MDIVWKMAKIIVTKANSLGVLPHLECVWLRRLHFCCFHWTRGSLPKKFSWDHPKTRLGFEKCPEQKDNSLRTPFASNYDRNRLWDVRQGCQPPPFGGTWACPRWSAGSGPTASAFFKSLLQVTHKMFMLITYITCFAIYLETQQCINFYFRGNISSFMTENNSSRFFSGRLVGICVSFCHPLPSHQLVPIGKGAATKFCLREGTDSWAGTQTYLTPKFTFSSDFGHYIFKMLDC